MKREELPSIKNTIIGLFICLCALIVIFASAQVKAVVNPTADNITLDVQCANGRMGKGKCPAGQGLILFAEDFDSQADWSNATKSTVGSVPNGWNDAGVSEAWHPANGDAGTQPAMQINGNDPAKVYGGIGKSFVFYNESYDSNNWNSDGLLIKDFTPSDAVYLQYYVRFQDGFAADNEYGQLKQVRILSWDGPPNGRTPFFSSGHSAPIYIHDWNQTSYGLRHFHSFRCDDQATNYYCTNPTILNPIRQVISGDMSPNYTSDLVATNPQIPDLINGGFISRNTSPVVFHNNILGSQWNKVGIYLKLNSSQGIQDGIFKYWLNDQLIVEMNQVPWIGVGGSMSAKWNSLIIGGNNFYKFDLTGAPADRERWYAIDNILLMSELPQELK